MPCCAGLLNFIHSQISDQKLGLIAAGLRNDFTSRIAEITFAVELPDFPRLLCAYAIDGGNKIGVRDRVRGLLELPQIFGETSDRGGRIVDNLSAVQTENARALRKMAIVTDVHADSSVTCFENRI